MAHRLFNVVALTRTVMLSPSAEGRSISLWASGGDPSLALRVTMEGSCCMAVYTMSAGFIVLLVQTPLSHR